MLSIRQSRACGVAIRHLWGIGLSLARLKNSAISSRVLARWQGVSANSISL